MQSQRFTACTCMIGLTPQAAAGYSLELTIARQFFQGSYTTVMISKEAHLELCLLTSQNIAGA